MDKYLIAAPITLPAGALLDLSPEQAAAREYGLVKVGKHYRATLPVQFKAGETIGYAGDLPKALASSVQAAKVAKTKRASTRKDAGGIEGDPDGADEQDDDDLTDDDSSEALFDDEHPDVP